MNDEHMMIVLPCFLLLRAFLKKLSVSSCGFFLSSAIVFARFRSPLINNTKSSISSKLKVLFKTKPRAISFGLTDISQEVLRVLRSIRINRIVSSSIIKVRSRSNTYRSFNIKCTVFAIFLLVPYERKSIMNLNDTVGFSLCLLCFNKIC